MQYTRVVSSAVAGALVTLLGCADEHAAKGVNTGDGKLGVGSAGCEALDVDDCEDREGCAVVHGQRVDEENACLGERRPLACMELAKGCNAAIGHTRDREGRVWQFPSSSLHCLPADHEPLAAGARYYGALCAQSQARDASTLTWADASVTSPIDAGSPDCTKRDFESCEQLPYCELIRAPLLDEQRQCLGASVPAACDKRAVRRECTAAENLARDGEGRVFWFSGGCLPSSLTSIPWRNVESCSSQPSCETLDATDCGARAGCAILYGSPVDPTNQCIGEAVPLACMDTTKGCNAAIGYTRDPQGGVWQFTSASKHCHPSTHESLPLGQPVPWSSYGRCNPRPQATNQRCSELSTAQCSSDPSCLAISGLPYDAIRKCRWEQQVAVGCMQADQTCRPVVVYARYPGAEEAFEIASGCMPPKFERADDPGDIRSWPLCK